MKKEITIVDSLPPEKAKEMFKEWAKKNNRILNNLGDKDLILDHVIGSQGQTLNRYRIFLDENLADNVVMINNS
jgi:hypothetical protein